MERATIDSWDDAQDLFNLMCEEILGRKPLDVLREIYFDRPVPRVASQSDVLWVMEKYSVKFELSVLYEPSGKLVVSPAPTDLQPGLKKDQEFQRQANMITDPEIREVIPDNLAEIESPIQRPVKINPSILPDAPDFI